MTSERAPLERLAAAVGDYKWLLNGRDKTGRCTLGCEATEGQYHADDCPAGVLSAAYLAAVDHLVGFVDEPSHVAEPKVFYRCQRCGGELQRDGTLFIHGGEQ